MECKGRYLDQGSSSLKSLFVGQDYVQRFIPSARLIIRVIIAVMARKRYRLYKPFGSKMVLSSFSLPAIPAFAFQTRTLEMMKFRTQYKDRRKSHPT